MAFYEVARAQGFARRINDRMARLVENLGNDSPVVEDLKEKLDRFFPDNIRYKDGVMQLMKPAQLSDESSLEALENIEKETPTWGKIRSEYEEEFKKWKSEQALPEDITIQDYININMNLPSALSTMYTLLPDAYARQALNIMQQKGRRKTYEELSRVISNIDKAKNRGSMGGRLAYGV